MEFKPQKILFFLYSFSALSSSLFAVIFWFIFSQTSCNCLYLLNVRESSFRKPKCRPNEIWFYGHPDNSILPSRGHLQKQNKTSVIITASYIVLLQWRCHCISLCTTKLKDEPDGGFSSCIYLN